MSRLLSLPRLIVALGVVLLGLLYVAPAHADGQVSVRNGSGQAAIDPTYQTTLTVSGRGFQSIKKGHGGIYVQFGAVKGQWRPSQGGVSGHNYFIVPDSEAKQNNGFLKYVAFPGSDTAAAANGGVISPSGSWSTSINVPGATFKTYDRAGKVTTIDCRKLICGVLTIGAHGVTNARNETFTRVTVKDLYAGTATPEGSESGSAAAPATATPGSPTAEQAGVGQLGTGQPAAGVGKPTTPPTMTVDRASARPGRILAFSASGLTPLSQVSATFDNGRSGVGPLTVGHNGQVAGMLDLPSDISPGTYELRLVGEGDLPSVRFAVVADSVEPSPATQWQPWLFAGAGALALLVAVVIVVLRRRSARAH